MLQAVRCDDACNCMPPSEEQVLDKVCFGTRIYRGERIIEENDVRLRCSSRASAIRIF